MEDNHSKNSVSGDSTDLTIVKGEKTGIPKWLMVTVIAMAAVIVGLTVTLIAVIAGKSSGETSQDLPSSQSSQGAQIYSDSAGNGGSSVTEIPESQTGTSQPQVTENGVVLQYSVDNSWGEDGSMFYGLQLGITNNTGDRRSARVRWLERHVFSIRGYPHHNQHGVQRRHSRWKHSCNRL